MPDAPHYTVTIFDGKRQVDVVNNSAPDALAAARRATYHLFNHFTRVTVHDATSQETVELNRADILR